MLKRGDGAIAQLGERLHGMQEVGGSIPPGSTTLRPSGYAWRSRAMAKDGLETQMWYVYISRSVNFPKQEIRPI